MGNRETLGVGLPMNPMDPGLSVGTLERREGPPPAYATLSSVLHSSHWLAMITELFLLECLFRPHSVSDELSLLCSPNISTLTAALPWLGQFPLPGMPSSHRTPLTAHPSRPSSSAPSSQKPYPTPSSSLWQRVFSSLSPHHGLLSPPEALNTLLSNNSLTGEGQLSSGETPDLGVRELGF